MRKIFALLIISLTVLSSCSNDDTDQTENSQSFLVGKWESKEDYSGEEVSTDVDGEYIYTFNNKTVNYQQNDEEIANYDYTFNSENMELTVDGDVTFVEKISNNEIIIHNGMDGVDYRGTLFKRIN